MSHNYACKDCVADLARFYSGKDPTGQSFRQALDHIFDADCADCLQQYHKHQRSLYKSRPEKSPKPAKPVLDETLEPSDNEIEEPSSQW